MERVICLLIGYVFGLFQTAYFYGKAKGIDIRKYGSGNAGTTNALRVLGTKAPDRRRSCHRTQLPLLYGI